MGDELYTAPVAAELATTWCRIVFVGAAAVAPGTIRSWAHRGHLEATGLDENGHPVYAHTDIARAEDHPRRRPVPCRHPCPQTPADQGITGH